MSSNRLGLIARIDVVEEDGETVTPLDYKRGKRPHVAKGAYDPERVQLCLQGMILEEHGYTCHEGVLYFSISAAFSRGLIEAYSDTHLRLSCVSSDLLLARLT